MKAVLSLVPAVLAACAAPSSSLTYPPGPTAGFGETAVLGSLAIRPVSLVEDSRCPVDVQCIWAGRLVVTVEIGRGIRRKKLTMTLGEPIEHDGSRLTLVAARPERQETVPLDPGDYRLTFALEGGD